MQKSLTGLIVICLSAAAAAEDFDSVAVGPFSQLSTAVGQWDVTDGNALIDDQHAVSGRQCLQLTGGEQTTVVLKLKNGSDTSGALVFRAERWTRRAPFRFRIEKRAGDAWQEVYNGDQTIRVGRPFLSHIKVPLGDPQIRELRFTVTSPPATGILIDDLRLAPATPMKVTTVTQVPWTVPVLAGRESCGLTCVRIETQGSLKPLVLTSLDADLKCSIDDVASVHVSVGADQRFASAKQVGSALELRDVGGTQAHDIQLALKQVLQEGPNYVWLACQPGAAADIDHQVTAAIRTLEFSNGLQTVLSEAPSVQRLGVALRQAGDDGVHTYRIPGLTTTTTGTLIGVYDVRRRSGGDLPGDIDVGMSRSTDGGRTWEPMQIIMDMGENPTWMYDGIGDPAVLVDRNTNTIWVAATWSHGNRSWRGSGQGLTPEETGQLMLVRSDDDGRTWSHPINITRQVKNPDWCFILQGPGKGITMQDGTLVFAAQYQDPPDRRRLPHSSIIYSRDHGKTWHVGSGSFDDTTEAQVVEVSRGLLMLNCRYNRAGTRVVMTTRDMGRTWQRHETSQRSLIEPGACMASLIDVDHELGKDLGGWILFSNPDSGRARERIMIKGSPDGGLTWPRGNRLLLDQERGRGYSCMTMIDSDTIGILYEGSQADMTFQRIPLAAVTAARKPVAEAILPALRSAKGSGSCIGLQFDVAFPYGDTRLHMHRVR